MASKYAHVIDKLPRHLGTEPAHQAKVDAVKTAMINDPEFQRTGSALSWAYTNLRLMRESMPIKEVLLLDPDAINKTLKELMSDLQVQIDAVEQMMSEQFEVEGVTSVNLDIGYTIRVQKEPYAKVVDKEAFRLWCLGNGLERQMHLLWATTNSLCKDRLLESEPEPTGIELKSIIKTFLTRR